MEMEFGLKKCGFLVLQRGMVVRSEGMELTNESVRKGTLAFLRQTKENEMKSLLREKYIREIMLDFEVKIAKKK